MIGWWRTRRAARDPGAALRRGMLKQARGDLAGAERAYWSVVVAAELGGGTDSRRRRAVRPDPERAAVAAQLLGEVLEDQGDPDAAADAYRRASRATDRGVRAHALLSLGVLLQDSGDTAGAVEAFQRAARSGDKAVAREARGHLKTLRARPAGTTVSPPGPPPGLPPATTVAPPGTAVVKIEDRALGEELVADRGKLEAMLAEWDALHLVGLPYEGRPTAAGYEIWFHR